MGHWIAAAAAIALACAAVPAAARTVVAVRSVFYAAPLPVVQVTTVRMQREWVPGHWEWQGDGHVWVPGRLAQVRVPPALPLVLAGD
jgi:hypothetical protein